MNKPGETKTQYFTECYKCKKEIYGNTPKQLHINLMDHNITHLNKEEVQK